jgi:hypothetical protein
MGSNAGSRDATSVSCQVVPNVEVALSRGEGAIVPKNDILYALYDTAPIFNRLR